MRTFRKKTTISPSPKNVVRYHITNNSCLKKIYDNEEPILGIFSINRELEKNPECQYQKKKLKTCKKKSNQPQFKKCDLDVRIQGERVF